MSRPLISIIVPVYNVEQYLKECLDSLMSQTYSNIEIICFNDASTDNSISILNDYAQKDQRFKVINSLVNIRQGGGRNRGIKASSGEYICFVDSDDWVEKNYIEKLYEALCSSNADIATSDYFEYYDGNLKEVSHLGKNIKCNTLEIKKKILLKGCRLCTSIFKKELITENNLYFPENVIYEDNAIAPALFLSAKKIKKIDDNLYYYRQNPSSTTKIRNNYSFFDRLDTSILAIENIRSLQNYRSDLYDNLKEEIDWLFIKLYLLGTLIGTITMFKPIPIDKIHTIFKGIDEHMPNWRNNKYYKKQYSITKRSLIMLIAYFPTIICSIIDNFPRK